MSLSHLVTQCMPSLIEALRDASVLLMDYYQAHQNSAIEVHQKEDDTPVTAADKAIHVYFMTKLQELTPDIPVLSEELEDFSQRRTWSTFWLLDPLDGTKEFIHKTDQFTINLALVHQNQIVWSAIAVPCEQLIYIGFNGLIRKYVGSVCIQEWDKDSWKQAHPLSRDTLTIAISNRSKIERLPSYQPLFDAVYQMGYEPVVRSFGSAYKFCLLIEGELDVYPRFHPTSEWDTASGQGLLNIIGGGVYHLPSFQPFTYNVRDQLLNGSFIASHHDELVDAFKEKMQETT